MKNLMVVYGRHEIGNLEVFVSKFWIISIPLDIRAGIQF
jgi:hypothetical protein